MARTKLSHNTVKGDDHHDHPVYLLGNPDSLYRRRGQVCVQGTADIVFCSLDILHPVVGPPGLAIRANGHRQNCDRGGAGMTSCPLLERTT